MSTHSQFIRLVCSLGLVLAVASVASPQIRLENDLKKRLPPSKSEQTEALPIASPQGVADALPTGAIARLGDSRLRHAEAPTSVVFTADSKRVVSAGQDWTLRVWDVKSGDAVHAIHTSAIPVSLRRLAENNRIAVGFNSNELRLINSNTWQESTTNNVDVTSDFAISGDGLLFANHYLESVTVTELNGELPKLELDAGNQVVFPPDGKTVAVANSAGKVTFYKLSGGKPVFTFDHGSKLNGFAMSADGKRFATGSMTDIEVLKIWERGNSKPVAELKGLSTPRAWLGDNRIVAANASGIGVFDLKEKKWVGFARGVRGEWDVSPDGTKLASTGSDGFHIQLWDLTTGNRLHTNADAYPDITFVSPTKDGNAVFFLSENRAFVSATDKSKKVSQVGTLPSKALTASSAASRLAIATPGGILIYDGFDSTQPLPNSPSRSLTEFATNCKVISLSPDGQKVAFSREYGNRTTIANATDGKVIRVLPLTTAGLGLAFTPDNEKIAVLGRDGFLRLFSVDAPAGEGTGEIWQLRVQRAPKGAVAISPDGKTIAVTSATQLLIVSATDGSVVFTASRNLFYDGPFQLLCFSRDGRLLISGSAGMNGAVQAWDIKTQSLLKRFATGFGAITALGISEDGTRIVSGGVEEAITVWDLTR